jgi:hypothetical protein
MAVGVEQLSRDAVIQASVESLGFNAGTLDLDAPESLAAALRRTASLRCPIGTRALLDATVAVLDGLATRDDLRSELSELLRAMVAYGDLVELTTPADQTGSVRLLYLAPPTFVQTVAGTFVLLGIRPEGAPLVDDALLPSILYERHTRTISGEDPEAVVAALKASGLQEINPARWLRAPAETCPESVVAEMDRLLLASSPSGDATGLQLLDPSTPVGYYRGRWRPAKTSDSGTYVARREQAYGSDLWSYVQVAKGVTTRVVDLPTHPDMTRGCDEAWRIQAAIDACAGHPQRFRIEHNGAGQDVLSLFSPPPSWLQRRWDGRGLPISNRGALVSYVLTAAETPGEAEFLRRMLWLEETSND